MNGRLPVLTAMLLVAACAQPEYVPGDVETTEFDDALYIRAAAAGMPVYRIDTVASTVFIRVGRAGTLKAAGHDHVIASTVMEGMVLVAADWAESRADLRIPLVHLVVDDATHRQRFGLEPDVSASAINGTTRNMQDEVLESALYPEAVASARLTGPDSDTLHVTLSLHGVTREYTVPCELFVDPGFVSVSGSLVIEHEDFGLTPFSAAGGLLRVAGEIELEFELSARRWGELN